MWPGVTRWCSEHITNSWSWGKNRQKRISPLSMKVSRTLTYELESSCAPGNTNTNVSIFYRRFKKWLRVKSTSIIPGIISHIRLIAWLWLLIVSASENVVSVLWVLTEGLSAINSAAKLIYFQTLVLYIPKMCRRPRINHWICYLWKLFWDESRENARDAKGSPRWSPVVHRISWGPK